MTMKHKPDCETFCRGEASCDCGGVMTIQQVAEVITNWLNRVKDVLSQVALWNK